jgi:hypothetical protein
MSETKSIVRYDYNYLQQYCKENGIELLKDYSTENVNIYTIIEGKCVNCENNFSKGMKPLCINGGVCKKCGIKMRMEKIKCKNKELYGVEYALQSSTIKHKIKAQNLEKYGVEHPSQTEENKVKHKKTCLEKYGVEHISQSQDIKDKIKQTNLEKYGVENPSQSENIKNKKEIKCLYSLGVKNPFQSEEVKDKIRQTNLEKYEVENAQQNAEVAEKSAKNAYKSKEYIFPFGRIERIQGYEHYMLNELLQQENILETDIIVNRKDVPTIWYENANGKKHRYFVDCFIKSQNRCIEAKSTWTAQKKNDYIFLKQQALKNAGYECEIWIYNSKGEKVEWYK